MNYVRREDLKLIRESTGLGVRLFSKFSGISKSTIQKIEGDSNVTVDNIEKYLFAISEAFSKYKDLNVEYSLVIYKKRLGKS